MKNKMKQLVLGAAAAGVLLLIGAQPGVATALRTVTAVVLTATTGTITTLTSTTAAITTHTGSTIAQTGAISTTGGGISASSGTSAGATPFMLDGSYTSAALVAKTPARAGQLVFNSTLSEVCVSTGATVFGYARVKDAATCQ